MLGEMLFYFYLFFNTLHRFTAVCSLDKLQVTHIPSIPSISLKNNVPISLMEERLWRLSVSIKTKSKQGSQGIIHCQLHQSLSDLFPLSFFFLFIAVMTTYV